MNKKFQENHPYCETEQSGVHSLNRVSKDHPCPICGKPDWCSLSADEAVVIVKPGAGDPVVTQVRIKHRASGREAGGEGRNTQAVDETY